MYVSQDIGLNKQDTEFGSSGTDETGYTTACGRRGVADGLIDFQKRGSYSN